MFNKRAIVIFSILIFPFCLSAEPPKRWFSNAQVAQGKPLFDKYCATCHGAAGEGAPNWNKLKANGNYPPPPLNGSAHTWHHPIDVLEHQIRNGGASVGGEMPGFENALSPEEMRAIIAYFQHWWDDRIYSAWFRRSGLAKTEPPPTESGLPITRFLQRRADGRYVGSPEDTPVANIKRVKLGDSYVYITDDGRYVFSGAMIDLLTGRNLAKEK